MSPTFASRSISILLNEVEQERGIKSTALSEETELTSADIRSIFQHCFAQECIFENLSEREVYNLLYFIRLSMSGLKVYAENNKRSSSHLNIDDSPSKKSKILLDDASSDEELPPSLGGAEKTLRDTDGIQDGQLQINEEYARRFEHNKRREELDRLQDKYGKKIVPEEPESSTDSSSDEEEDDEGLLARGHLDAQVQQTLEAIQRKDPRVYDSKAIFYTDLEEDTQETAESKPKNPKPMFLSDYHRSTLLEGLDTQHSQVEPEPTFAEQQDELKASVVRELHQAANGDMDDEDEESEDGFLVKRPSDPLEHQASGKGQRKLKPLDVESADQNPDKFLADFMSARAWVPTTTSRFQALESDDEEEERRADAFEEAYNLRFESADIVNQKIVSHARDAVAKYTVRKEPMNARQRAREVERNRKSSEKQTKAEEKARLRKLQISEMEEKAQKIREAAGIDGHTIPDEYWSLLNDEAWDNSRWDEVMKQRFGEEYYASRDTGDKDPETSSRRYQPKKPKWVDDIDIRDIVADPDPGDDDAFVGGELDSAGHLPTDQEDSTEYTRIKQKQPNVPDRDKQRQLRLERQRIEQMVDEKIGVEEKLSNFGTKHSGHFRYRETSPLSWGLTTSDILMADDSQLNQYVGLKKLAAFRDPLKKQKDRKKLGKKGRLRQWRVETFGSKDGPKLPPMEVMKSSTQRSDNSDKADARLSNGASSKREGKRRRKPKKNIPSGVTN